jgi:4-amino-4-deoxy-L-arabinose transferase-like glycosyltransferase
LGPSLALWLTVAVGGGLLLLNTWTGSLLASDDAIYAQMARESLAAGRWLDHTWLSAVLFEKPPLLLWSLQLSGAVFGFSDFAMRLPGVLAGVVALVYAGRLAQHLTRPAAAAAANDPTSWRVGAVAAALTVATFGFAFNARRPMTDPLLTAALMAALFYAVRLADGRAPRGSAVGLGVAGGLGLMAKQLAVGPAALALVVLLVARRRWRGLGLAAAVLVAIAAPWHVAMTVRHGAAFWDVYLGYHVAARAGGALVGASDAGYYLTTFWSQEGLLGGALLLGLLAATFQAARGRRASLGAVVAAAWLTILAAQFSETRLYHYLMPLFPMAAVATAAAAARGLRRPVALAAAAAVALTGLVAGPLPHLLDPDYAPASRRVGREVVAASAPDTRLVIWEDYDPALIWYGERRGRLWTADAGFYQVQQSIDMMRRAQAVVRVTPEAVAALLADPAPVVAVAPATRAAGLSGLAQAAAADRAVTSRTLADRVVLSLGRRR